MQRNRVPGPLPDRRSSVICTGLTPHVDTVVTTGQADPPKLQGQPDYLGEQEWVKYKEETMLEMEQYKARRGCLKYVKESAPLYRHWGFVQAVRPVRGVEV